MSENLERYCVYLNYTIQETIEKIHENKSRMAVVLSKNNKVIGVISQGDIIRALCGGKNIYANIEALVHSSFRYAKSRDMPHIYEVFKKFDIVFLPIVDDDFHLVDVVVLQDIYKFLENK